MKLKAILMCAVLSCAHTAFADADQPDLDKLTEILGISLLSSKAEVDAMIATTGKSWQCQSIDNPEVRRPHGRTRFAYWSRTCTYQNPANLVQSQRFKVEAVGNSIYHLSFEDRVFDSISVAEWKKQPAELKISYGPGLDEAHTEVLKNQDASSPGQYREIDAGLKLTIDSECSGRPFDIAVSTITIEQGAVTTARFIAEYENFRGMCPESFTKKN